MISSGVRGSRTGREAALRNTHDAFDNALRVGLVRALALLHSFSQRTFGAAGEFGGEFMNFRVLNVERGQWFFFLCALNLPWWIGPPRQISGTYQRSVRNLDTLPR